MWHNKAYKTKMMKKIFDAFPFNNIYFVAASVFFVSIAVGITFYMIVNEWSFAASYFFAITVLLGNMYLIPTEASGTSQTFTLCFFLWGSILMAGAFTALANDLVSTAVRVASDERQRIIRTVQPEDMDNDGVVGFSDNIRFYGSKLIYQLGWYDYKSKYLTLFVAVMWVFVGVLYGLLFEGWPLYQSIYFAIAAMSASGSSPPDCVGKNVYDCSIGTERAYLMGTYIVVGVPLLAYTIGQFAGLIVEHAVRAKEMKLMMRPLTEEEFKFCRQLHKGILHHHDTGEMRDRDLSAMKEEHDRTSHRKSLHRERSGESSTKLNISPFRSTSVSVQQMSPVDEDEADTQLPLNRLDYGTPRTEGTHATKHTHATTSTDFSIDLGEFIVLELLRLQKIEMSDLVCLKALFDEIDDSGDGCIDMLELQKHNLATATASNINTPFSAEGNGNIQRFSGQYYGALNTSGDDSSPDKIQTPSRKGVLSRVGSLHEEHDNSCRFLRPDFARSRSDGSSKKLLETVAEVDQECVQDLESGHTCLSSDDNSDATVNIDNNDGLAMELNLSSVPPPSMSDMYNNMVIPVIQQLNSARNARDAPTFLQSESTRNLLSAAPNHISRRNSTSDIEVLQLSPTSPGRFVLSRDKKALLLQSRQQQNRSAATDDSGRVRRNTVSSQSDKGGTSNSSRSGSGTNTGINSGTNSGSNSSKLKQTKLSFASSNAAAAGSQEEEGRFLLEKSKSSNV